MTSIRNEPSLAPSGDSPAEKAEKVRGGRGLTKVVGVIAFMFLLALFGIIGFWFYFALTH